MCDVLERIFEFLSFFVRFLVWWVVTGEPDCAPNSDANQWGFNRKIPGTWGRSLRWGVFVGEWIAKVKYKIDHISKTKHRTKKAHQLINPFQNIAHLFSFFSQMDKNLRFLNDYISLNKNRIKRKIDFSFVSELCVSFWTKKWRRLFLRRDLHIVN